jgi:hypothetical protein
MKEQLELLDKQSENETCKRSPPPSVLLFNTLGSLCPEPLLELQNDIVHQ